MYHGSLIGETRICNDSEMAAGMSAVFRANTCCIADGNICRNVMHMSRNQWVYSAFKADKDTDLKREVGITAPGVPAIEIEALEKFRDTGLVPQLYAKVSTQVSIRGEIFRPATFVMEMLQGEEVNKYLIDRQRLWRDFLANGSAADAAAVEQKVNCVMQKIIRGMEIFEKEGYTHGDAHLANVFVTNNDTADCPDVKFIDFGMGSKNGGRPSAIDLITDIYKPLSYMDLIRGILQSKQDNKPAPPFAQLLNDPQSVRAIQDKLASSRSRIDLAPNQATERLLEQYTNDLFKADDVAFIFAKFGYNWRSAFDSAVSQSRVASLTPPILYDVPTFSNQVLLFEYLIDPASDFWANYLANPKSSAAAAGVVAKVQCVANNAINQIIGTGGYVRVNTSGSLFYTSGRQKNGCAEVVSTVLDHGAIHAVAIDQLVDTLNVVSYAIYRLTTDGLTPSLEEGLTKALTPVPAALVKFKSLSRRIPSGSATIALVPDQAFETSVRSILSRYPANRYFVSKRWIPDVHDPTGWVYSLGQKILLANHAAPLIRAPPAPSANNSPSNSSPSARAGTSPSNSYPSEQSSKSARVSTTVGASSDIPKVSDDFDFGKSAKLNFRWSVNSDGVQKHTGDMSGLLIAVIVISSVLVVAGAGVAIAFFVKSRQTM